MASGNLNFEFSRRWKEIGARLFPQPTPEQSEALTMLEQNTRDLEDAWPAPASTTPGYGSYSGTDATLITSTAYTRLTHGVQDFFVTNPRSTKMIILWVKAQISVAAGGQLGASYQIELENDSHVWHALTTEGNTINHAVAADDQLPISLMGWVGIPTLDFIPFATNVSYPDPLHFALSVKKLAGSIDYTIDYISWAAVSVESHSGQGGFG